MRYRIEVYEITITRWATEVDADDEEQAHEQGREAYMAALPDPSETLEFNIDVIEV